jgi:hypothetical protein
VISPQVLANDLPPFNISSDLNGLVEPTFYAALVNNLSFSPTEVFRTAAAILGMCMQYLAAQPSCTELLVCVSIAMASIHCFPGEFAISSRGQALGNGQENRGWKGP